MESEKGHLVGKAKCSVQLNQIISVKVIDFQFIIDYHALFNTEQALIGLKVDVSKH